jgi:hypothetical protein
VEVWGWLDLLNVEDGGRGEEMKKMERVRLIGSKENKKKQRRGIRRIKHKTNEMFMIICFYDVR